MTLPVVIVLLAGYAFLRMQARQLQAATEANLTSIAQLKAHQISDWRLERLSDAVAFSDDPTFVADVNEWMQAPQPQAETEIMTRLKALESNRQYSDAVLVDAAGQPRLSLTGRLLALDAEDRAALADAFQSGRPRFYDLHISSANGAIDMDALAPLMSAAGKPVGAIVLQIDPQRYLYPLLQAWPVTSASAESLLVRREGDEVVWLNNLRYQPDAALKLRMPLTATNVPAVKAALGTQGTFRGSDYRGVGVFSALEPVPDSPWFLVAKEDSAEALSFLRPITGLVALSLACLLVTVGVTGGLAWQQTQKRYYRAIYVAEAERLALARHFEYLVKYANDMILLTDANFQVVEANDRALETYGYSRQEMLKLTLADLAAPEDAAIYQEHQRILRANGSDRREAWQRRRDGSVFPAEVSARAIDVEGQPYYQGILRDITDRKRAEQVIQGQNEQLQAQNEELTAQREELQAQNEELAAQQEELLESRAGLEARVRERTDELEKANAVLEEQIEERRQAEERVRQNARRLSVLAEVSQALVAAGPDYRTALDPMVRSVAQFNSDACVIHLLSSDGQRLDRVAAFQATPNASEAVPETLAAGPQGMLDEIAGRVLHTKAPVCLPALSIQDLRRQARPGWLADLDQAGAFSLLAVPLMIQTEVLGSLVIYRLAVECAYSDEDLKLLQSLADRVALALANAQLYQDLKNALAQEKAVRQQLIQAEKLSALGRMVGSVAHELNNPLQTITNCLYLTGQDLAPDSPIHDYLEMAQAETLRLVNLVAQLRELYRTRPTSAPQACRLGALLRQVQALLALQLQSANVRWQEPAALPDYAVEATPDRLKQVFINLATNAVEAMRPAGGELRVDWARSADGKQVGVSFEDTGPGIEPEHLSRLFEPFFTTKDHGLGLGLSICHEIVQQHDGQITVVSRPGQGAQFTVWLPLATHDGA